MKAIQQHNRAILIKAAELLRPLQENFVFLGGMALTLLVSDPAAPDVRPTEDVDVVVEAATYLKYNRSKNASVLKGLHSRVKRNRQPLVHLCR